MGHIGKKWVVAPNRFLRHEEIRALRTSAHRSVVQGHWEGRARVFEYISMEIAFGSGLRVAEIASLNCGDLSLGANAGVLFVRRGKGGKSRQVIISADLCRTLRRFLRWKIRRGESDQANAPLLLSSQTGAHLTTRALQKMFERVIGRSGIRRCRFHDMRHTYCSYLLKSSGNDLVFVKEQMGHADLSTTSIYLHALNAEKAVNSLYA
ncbi:tyrosine-type recombinase/integrase [Elusimicrobiota bacterium]